MLVKTRRMTNARKGIATHVGVLVQIMTQKCPHLPKV